MTPPQRRITLAALVALHLGADLIAIPIADKFDLEQHGGEFLGPLLFGAVLGQFGMVATYLAWGSGYWIARWLTSFLAVVLMWYALAYGAVSTGDSFSVSSIETLFGLVGAMLFLVVPLPFWATRRLFCRRIQATGESDLASHEPLRQFGIRHLMIWTAATAVVFAVGRFAIRTDVWSEWRMPSSDTLGIFLFVVTVALLCVLVAIPSCWAALVERQPGRMLAAVGVYAILVAVLETAVLSTMFRGGMADQALKIVPAINLGVVGEVVTCSLALRACGYRFVFVTSAIS